LGVSTDTARQLRQKPTPSEVALWQCLRERGVDHKFRRQHRLSAFVLDFFCPALRLAVEVDGGIHSTADQAAYDRFRQVMTEGYGVSFVRLSSEEVECRLSESVTKIALAATTRTTQVSYDLRWTAAGELAVGDAVLFGRNRREALVEDTMTDEATQLVCDLAVEKDGSYITEVCILRGVAAHPSLPPPLSGSPLSSLGEGNEG
jgi:very-short-patch-repair endonuclease